MSRTKPTETERVQLRFHCGTCGARPKEWCVGLVNRNRPASYLHSFRYNEAVKLRLLPLTGQEP